MVRSSVLLCAALAAACSPQSGPTGDPAGGSLPERSSTRKQISTAAPHRSPASPTAVASAPDAGAIAEDAGAAGPVRAPAIAFEAAARLLFPPEGKSGEARLDPGAGARTACASGSDEDRVKCLLGRRYEPDVAAGAAALALFASAGSVAGLEREHVMNGGFRGTIKLVPELPVGKYARHLAWIAEGTKDHLQVLDGLASRGGRAPSFRIRAIEYRFFRSVGRTTPSAYATGWSVAYNVSGSLHGSATAVRETLWHEIFHLNDAARGGWSRPNLGKDFDAIVARCGTRMPCLTPYAPGTTTVRGGTYYAFQPDNGDAVNEYAAELALRYYKEHRAILRGEPPGPPFKCGPEPNARAWKALADEFFAGVDLVPSCK